MEKKGKEKLEYPVKFEVSKSSVRMTIPRKIVEAMGGIKPGTVAIVIYEPATPKTLKVKIY